MLDRRKNLSLFLNQFEGNQFPAILQAHYIEIWRFAISRYSPQFAQLLLTRVDADACNTALLGACNDHRALEQPQIQARLNFIKVLLENQKGNPNIRRCDIRREIGITWEAEYTPLLLACVQADSERVQLILDHPETDPNMLNKGQPLLLYLFRDGFEGEDPDCLKKVLQLLVNDSRIVFSPELLSHIEASPNVRLREAFMQEPKVREWFEEERESNPIAKFNQMLEEFNPSSSKVREEEIEEMVRAFSSSPALTFGYDAEEEAREDKKKEALADKTMRRRVTPPKNRCALII